MLHTFQEAGILQTSKFGVWRHLKLQLGMCLLPTQPQNHIQLMIVWCSILIRNESKACHDIDHELMILLFSLLVPLHHVTTEVPVCQTTRTKHSNVFALKVSLENTAKKVNFVSSASQT